MDMWHSKKLKNLASITSMQPSIYTHIHTIQITVIAVKGLLTTALSLHLLLFLLLLLLLFMLCAT